MPVQPTYPGVYVEEIPSGVRTISGVPTSITAFVGRALRGPVSEPVVINGYGDFERNFGGLSLLSSASFALRDYFLNGGGQAIFVRLFNALFASDADADAAVAAMGRFVTALTAATDPTTITTISDGASTGLTGSAKTFVDRAAAAAKKAAQDAKNATKTNAEQITAASDAARVSQAEAVSRRRVSATLRLTTDEGLKATGAGATTPTPPALVLVAANPGAWGNELRARVEIDEDTNPLKIAASLRLNVPVGSLFNLIVRDMATGITEVFNNVTVTASARQLSRVLETESTLVRVVGTPSTRLPIAHDTLKNVDLGKPPFTDENELRSTKVAPGDRVTDGPALEQNHFTGPGLENGKAGLFALERTETFNMLCIPPHDLAESIESDLVAKAAAYCEKRRAMLIVDPPATWRTKDAARTGFTASSNPDVTTRSKNAAIFFPRVVQPNPLRENQLEAFAPCGVVAGVIARTDAQRGIFKAPAGIDATLIGVPDLAVQLTDAENGELNPLGINCLRTMPAAGRVVWGARTLQGDDRLASEWKYLPVRRLALFIEESLYRGTQWVVFEGNDEPLWSQIRLNVGAFMNNLFRQGAFQGRTPREAYFVKCDRETTTQNDINLGVVNIVVGFAPLKPAEFVFIKLQQLAGQISA